MDRFLAGDISREELELLDSAMGDRPDDAFNSYAKSSRLGIAKGGTRANFKIFLLSWTPRLYIARFNF